MIAVRFYRHWLRPMCSVCGSTVSDVEQHARWHHALGESSERQDGTHRAYKDAIIEGDRVYVTGWLTIDTGPR